MAATNFTPIQLYHSTTASAAPTAGNLAAGELAINTLDEKLYFKNSAGTVKLLASAAGAAGDVVGPASATDNAVVRFDGTTGKLIQNSVVTIADTTGNMAGVGTLGVGAITTSGALTYGGVTLSNSVTGTGSMVLSASPTLTGTLAAAAANFSGAVALGDAAADNITVNGTVTSNLIFTDNTYDIGASSATRPRNLFLAGNATVGGDIVLTGSLDLTNLEVTNIKAKDGTAGMQIADSTGVVSFTANPVLSGGTANGVTFLNGSKVLTSGSALTFDGTRLGIGSAGNAEGMLTVGTGTITDKNGIVLLRGAASSVSATQVAIFNEINGIGSGESLTLRSPAGFKFQNNDGTSEQMRLTSSLLSVVPGATIQGLTVGLGAGAVATNTAVGASALAATTTGDASVAVGYEALKSNTTGEQQVAIGFRALLANTTGTLNVAIGRNALGANTTGGSNTALGTLSLASNTTASGNTAVGYQAGYSNTTASSNTAVGYQAAHSSITGSDITAVGYQAYYLGTAVNNTAFGSRALGNAIVTGAENTAIGRASLFVNTSGANNTAVGTLSLFSNTTASNNTAVGYQAGYSNTTGANLVALGHQAAFNNTTGGSNTAVGQASLSTNTTGAQNTAVGARALRDNTASDNTAVGYHALILNSTGTGNTALGNAALISNTTASNNTAVGYQAGYSNTTGAYNTFIGYQAGYTSNRTVDGYGANLCVGYQAGYSLTGGQANTFVGSGNNGGTPTGAGSAVTTGFKNTIIGAYTGNQGGLDIRTASNYIVLSDGDGNPRGIFDNSGNLLVGTTSAYASSKLSVLGSGAFNTGGVDGTFTSFINAIYSGNTAQFASIQHSMSSSPTLSGFRFLGGGAGGAGTTQEKMLDLTRGQTIFYTGDTERARITNDGTFRVKGAGTAGSTDAFQVAGTAPADAARIDSNGNFLLGTTSVTASPVTGVQLANGGSGTIGGVFVGHATGTATGNYYATFSYDGGIIGSITQSGTTAVLYNLTSDQRLKENIQDAAPSSSLIDAIQVRQYNWKSDGSHQRYGFIAQELVTVAPEAVYQPADPEEMMAVDYSKLVPMLVKEIQDLRQRLAAAGI